jgi:hypothetical protein
MVKDPKVISLEERRRGGARARPHGRASAQDAAPAQAGEAAAPAQAGEAQPAQADAAPGAPAPVPGRLIWLYCPSCRTLEYTELELGGGRVHNLCGTQVHEAAVELDLRAEATIAKVNLERLAILEQLLAGQRERYEEYLRRLALAAGRPLEPYPAGPESAAGLPVADVDAFGLLVSRFFHDPAGHFPELAPEPEPETPPPGPASA